MLFLSYYSVLWNYITSIVCHIIPYYGKTVALIFKNDYRKLIDTKHKISYISFDFLRKKLNLVTL